MLHVALVLFIALTAATPLPSREGHCGPSQKITYSETILPSDLIDDLDFVSSDNQLIFIRTTDSHVYRSKDEGMTWQKQTVPEIMPNLDSKHLITHIYNQETRDKSITLFFLSSDGKMWISDDGGETYKFINDVPSGTQRIYPQEFYKGIFLARRSVGQTHELWLGDFKNSSVKWDKLLENLPPHARVSWSKFANSNPNRIYATRHATSDLQTYKNEIVYSDDFFKTTKILSPPNVRTWYHMDPNKFVVISCVDASACTSKTMFISEDGGGTFSNPPFPDYRTETLVESDFYVYEITDDAIWARVERSGCSGASDSCWGDMFHSDAGDKAFSLSLRYLRNWDFTKYNSVDGIYVANQYITDGSLPTASDSVRSMITFNKGSQWEPIRAPLVNAIGQPYKGLNGGPCTPANGCSLHIHGWSSPLDAYTYFYSIPNAIGLMVASGNVGSSLDERGDLISFYVSNSAGSNWTEIRQGIYVPEIGDHGSIIAIVNAKEPTNEVLYNIGDPEDLSQWLPCQFSTDKISAKNIRVSEGWDSRRFVLYGQKKNPTTGEYNAVVYHLNFENEFSGQCKESDLSAFTPKNLHGNCVMGRSTTYYRRAPGKTCYYGEVHEKIMTSANCECQTEDYECAHCFYRPDLSSDCVQQCSVPGAPAPNGTECVNGTGYYTVELFGYRRVDNDTCDPNFPNAEKPKSRIPCQPTTPSTTSGGIFHINELSGQWTAVIVVILIIMLIIGVVTFLWKYNSGFYDLVRYTLGIEDGRTVESAYQTVQQEEAVPLQDDDEEEELAM